MNFNELIREKIIPLFEKNNFFIVEEIRNSFYLRSLLVEVMIAYDELGRESMFGFCIAGEGIIYLEDKSMKEVFKMDLKITQVTKEVFADYVYMFLQGNGRAILVADKSKLIEFRNFMEDEAYKFTSTLLKQQALEHVDKAWQRGDYKKFLELVDKIGYYNLSPIYQKKYSIAMKRNRGE